jgi:PAS domain S-box-containing protein
MTAQHEELRSLLHHATDKNLVQSANRYLQEMNRRIGSEALYVMGSDGVTLAASNWYEPKSFVGDNYSFRPYFKDAMDGRNGFFYAIGTSTGIPGLFISAPLRENGWPIGVVVIKVRLQEIEETWRRSEAPVYLSDDHGVVILSSVPDWTYRATHALQASDLDWIAEHLRFPRDKISTLAPWAASRTNVEQGFETVIAMSQRPSRFLVVEEMFPEFNWTLGVMSDLAPVGVARVTSMSLMALLLVVLTLGTLYWRQRERRLREQRDARIQLEERVRERTAELRESHAFRKAMGDSLLVGMRARDLEGRIIYINPAFSDITGFGESELIGRLPPYPYWHPDHMEKHWYENQAALTGQAELAGFESLIRHRDGSDVMTMVYTAPLIDAAGKHSGWMSSVVDITAQKAAEEKARLQTAAMQRTGRLASMGEMASTLAHELSQPLTALVRFAGAARAYADRDHKELLVETVSDITTQATRAAEIVNRIRGFVKQQSQGIADCQINAVVNNVLALVRSEIRHQQARVVTRLPDDLPAIRADSVLLEQVVLNLVLNAVQAMHQRYPADKVVQIETGLQGDWVYVRVLDNGPGISESDAAQLFQPFFTTKPDGLGLGLNICRTTVEAHRGRLTFENRPEGGAVFTMWLPIRP